MERNGWGQSLFVRYGVAVLAVGSVVTLRLGLNQYIQWETPFLLFLGAVTAVAWYGGIMPGLTATILAAASVDYFFLPPLHSFGLVTPVQRVESSLFLFEGVLISTLCELLHRATRRAERSEKEARNLEREILEISENEKRRIGHDLHDGLGQHLTGIAFLSKVLQQRLMSRSSPEATDAMRISELVSQSIGWTRDLARGLSPVSIEADGLASALLHLAELTHQTFGIDCKASYDLSRPLPHDQVAVHLYRIAQEAVSNAVRHGQPSRVQIQLIDVAEQIRLEVTDNGSGFQPPPAGARTGLGLQIMNYRARMIGADLKVMRGQQSGTIVSCSLARLGIASNPQQLPGETSDLKN